MLVQNYCQYTADRMFSRLHKNYVSSPESAGFHILLNNIVLQLPQQVCNGSSS